mmetsp:Transcript_8947/g.16120  ORF Transcript_8947/g.16120 Transcript_8947/m.16120 type:complete len:574 (+) Transcript_8947:198-1919(+)
MTAKLTVSLLDYGAGNVRSVRNAITSCGYTITDITHPSQINDADVIIFPGVGSYHSAMDVLKKEGYDAALREYLKEDRPYLGICLGMQTLFESSEETNESGHTGDPLPGLGVIPGKVIKFDETKRSVPHIGWNGAIAHQKSPAMKYIGNGSSGNEEEVYFVHSYYAPITEENSKWVLTRTTYEGQEYISSVQRGNVCATQFHPEKSGTTGLNFLKGFLEAVENGTLSQTTPLPTNPDQCTQLVKRVVVALDVRSNDAGDLVVTKGDQYDVREKDDSNAEEGGATTGRGGVRNLGKPVQLAARYYTEGADEIAFLNITSFRQGVIEDMPMLQVLEEASKCVFVPLTVGGGIRSYTDPESKKVYSALEVASRYFRAGADKISIGSDAVIAAEEYYKLGMKKTGETSIETISQVYGVQAVVISIDPKRVYVSSPDDVDKKHTVVSLEDGQKGPNGEQYCWYQCTVKGGREAKDICAVTVAKAAEALGAGEIMLNCIDMDGQCNGFDHALMNAVSGAVTIPVIASSGAGCEKHFVDVFEETGVQAALAAGMFHRKEVEIGSVKKVMEESGIRARIIG